MQGSNYMRINEYTSLKEFADEFTGVWNPSSGHWLGLDFMYNNVEYRFHTGAMYNTEDTVLPDGRTAKYGVYRRHINSTEAKTEYELIGEYAEMDDALEYCLIDGIKLKDVIMDDDTRILGKD